MHFFNIKSCILDIFFWPFSNAQYTVFGDFWFPSFPCHKKIFCKPCCCVWKTWMCCMVSTAPSSHWFPFISIWYENQSITFALQVAILQTTLLWFRNLDECCLLLQAATVFHLYPMRHKITWQTYKTCLCCIINHLQVCITVIHFIQNSK